MQNHTIAILGAGVGGIIAADELRRRLPDSHRIVLIEKNTEHAFAPSFLWVMTGLRAPGKIARPLKDLVRPGVEILHGEVLGIDLSTRKISTSSGALNYDYLVIALGADLAAGSLPGLAGASSTFYTLDGARKLRGELARFMGGSIAIVVCSMPYKCPGAPHEAAMLIADYFKKRGMRNSVRICGPYVQECTRNARRMHGTDS